MTDLGKSSSRKKEPFWWAARINSLIQEGRTVQAIKTLDRLMEKNQDRIYALQYKVRLLWRRKRVKEAIAWVCLEAELRPRDPQVLALKDDLMAFYPYSLFDACPPADLLSGFRRMDDEWPDVAGMQEIKIQLHNDLILPLRHREKFKRFGVELPNGILFYGPPGCGKTYLARRLAEKIGYGFHEVSLSRIAGPYVHQTAIGIGALFEVAAEKGPTLLFMDEVDSLGTDRNSTGVAAHRLEIVNELLKQMDLCHE